MILVDSKHRQTPILVYISAGICHYVKGIDLVQ